ncbi:hypothetical protein Tco_1327552 [Tanacetum coccineum]
MPIGGQHKKQQCPPYLAKCLTCAKVKAEHQRPSGMLVQPKIPDGSGQHHMDFCHEAFQDSQGYDTIFGRWFTRHGYPPQSFAIATRDSSSNFLRSTLGTLGYNLDMSTLTIHNNDTAKGSFKLSRIWLRACVQSTWKCQNKQRASCRDRQKSYADLKCKPMEFQVGDKVMLKVSPWKGVVRFGKRGKLNPGYVGPFKPLAVPLDGLNLDDQLYFVEEPVEIVGREVKRLKRSRIPLVKVQWNSKRGPEFTWEREDQFMKKYPHLFTKTSPSSSAAS